MAASQSSFRTQSTINISQGAESSPDAQGNTVQVNESVERVEDSIKDIAEAYRGGSVQSPDQPQHDKDHDELYSLTPQREASNGSLKAAATKHQSPTLSRSEMKSNPGGKDGRVVQDDTTDDSLKRTSVDALLATGASVGKAPPQHGSRQNSRR